MRFSSIITTLFACTVCICCSAQVSVKKRIKKGRRNKTEHLLTLDKKTLEVDWEFGYEIITDSLENYVYPNLALRYGISNNVEINLELNPITTIQKLPAGKQKTSGMEPVFIGTRIKLADEKKYLPAMALSFQIAPPFAATKNYEASYWAPFVQYTLQKYFGNQFSMDLSGGVLWDGFSTSPSYLFTVSPSFDFNDTWNITADVFGFTMNHAEPMNNFDLGFTCQLNDRLSFGAVAGKGITSSSHKGYAGINGSYSFNLKRKKTTAN